MFATALRAFSILVALGSAFISLPASASPQEARAAFERGDYQASLRLWLPLAKGGSVEAQSFVGLLYLLDRGTSENKVEAAKWFRMAAEQGEPSAQFQLGSLYAAGEGVPKNVVEAERWLKASANQNWSVAQYRLGVLYLDRKNDRASQKEAIHWLTRAANSNVALAQFELGILHYSGLDGVIAKDLPIAYHWLKRAISNGLDDPAVLAVAEAELKALPYDMTPKERAQVGLPPFSSSGPAQRSSGEQRTTPKRPDSPISGGSSQQGAESPRHNQPSAKAASGQTDAGKALDPFDRALHWNEWRPECSRTDFTVYGCNVSYRGMWSPIQTGLKVGGLGALQIGLDKRYSRTELRREHVSFFFEALGRTGPIRCISLNVGGREYPLRTIGPRFLGNQTPPIMGVGGDSAACALADDTKGFEVGLGLLRREKAEIRLAADHVPTGAVNMALSIDQRQFGAALFRAFMTQATAREWHSYENDIQFSNMLFMLASLAMDGKEIPRDPRAAYFLLMEAAIRNSQVNSLPPNVLPAPSDLERIERQMTLAEILGAREGVILGGFPRSIHKEQVLSATREWRENERRLLADLLRKSRRILVTDGRLAETRLEQALVAFERSGVLHQEVGLAIVRVMNSKARTSGRINGPISPCDESALLSMADGLLFVSGLDGNSDLESFSRFGLSDIYPLGKSAFIWIADSLNSTNDKEPFNLILHCADQSERDPNIVATVGLNRGRFLITMYMRSNKLRNLDLRTERDRARRAAWIKLAFVHEFTHLMGIDEIVPRLMQTLSGRTTMARPQPFINTDPELINVPMFSGAVPEAFVQPERYVSFEAVANSFVAPLYLGLRLWDQGYKDDALRNIELAVKRWASSNDPMKLSAARGGLLKEVDPRWVLLSIYATTGDHRMQKLATSLETTYPDWRECIRKTLNMARYRSPCGGHYLLYSLDHLTGHEQKELDAVRSALWEQR